MTDFTNHKDVTTILTESQDSDSDNRDAARKAQLFLHKKDGQWEPSVVSSNSGRPKYTFDLTSPVVDQVSGEMEQADFDITIKPAGGDTTKDDAMLLDGLVRNIENISSAKEIFNEAGRNMVTCGISGWQIKQEYVDDDSFDQDLVIKRIANFVDSVWFGPYKEPDGSDAKWCVVLEAIDRRTYDDKYPKGKGQSVSEARLSESYCKKGDQIIIGNIYYIEERMRTLLLMSDGQVLEEEKALPVLDELAQAGITVKQTRKRAKNIVKSRLFDGGGWLNEDQETVFNQIPVIPTIGNFNIMENKVIYSGVVEKLMDAQRVFNYAKSREIEEGALAPRAKYWMTAEQAEGHEEELGTLNTNAHPVQFYNSDSRAPVPQQQGGAVINQGLKVVSDDMRQIVSQSAGLFAANMGDNPNAQSGIAIRQLQQKGDTGTIKYFKAQERAISRTARILVDAIPVVYSSERQARILKEDGTFSLKTLNQPVFDQQTQRLITVNDMSKGKYDVACSSGPSFQNRQQETVAAITEIAAIDPSVVEIGSDILLSSIPTPGMNLLAERKRQQLLQSGAIPQDQLTEEEQQQIALAQQQAEQNPQQDPNMLIAQAEMQKAEADINAVNVKAQIAKSQEQRANFEAENKAENDKIKLQLEQAKIDQGQQQVDLKQMMALFSQQMEQNTALLEEQKLIAETLKTTREAMGVDAITGPDSTSAYIKQATQLDSVSDELLIE